MVAGPQSSQGAKSYSVCLPCPPLCGLFFWCSIKVELSYYIKKHQTHNGLMLPSIISLCNFLIDEIFPIYKQYLLQYEI
ncbi:MAG TPA: hypothetical protein DIW07_06305 [Lachnospiraceae bacterium]|nr:hypothetical protein [Lachnospiraceae bacterium]HCR83016.1 hypothetical protein [Lachnospiraceae bacterium]